MKYPELDELKQFIAAHNIKAEITSESKLYEGLIPVMFQMHNTVFVIQVNDEYNDLNYNNAILNVLLALREFAIVEDSNDFEHWCKLNEVRSISESLRTYFSDTQTNLRKIEHFFPNNSVEYYISDLDFQLNSGPMQVLRS